MVEEERRISVVVGILKTRDHLEGIGVRRSIILKMIAKKVVLKGRAALICLMRAAAWSL